MAYTISRVASTNPGHIGSKAGADWPYNEVGKIPRGPSSLGAPQHHDLFFF
jgi:hypothetical protein